ncbi:hypothetical protein N7523_010677 [Penicillium sp. IBT 18751x]|nr:hypothetical protein N7523_010677 [Penicillium sp. IBT 18751x]
MDTEYALINLCNPGYAKLFLFFFFLRHQKAGTRRRTVTTTAGSTGNVATGRDKKTAPPRIKEAKVAIRKGKALANTPPADQDITDSETGSDQERLNSVHDFVDNPVAISNILRSDLPVLAGPSSNQLQRVTTAIASDANLCARLRLDFDNWRPPGRTGSATAMLVE